jgi:hypothetical protein
LLLAGARRVLESGAMPILGTFTLDLKADDGLDHAPRIRSEAIVQSKHGKLCTLLEKEDYLGCFSSSGNGPV